MAALTVELRSGVRLSRVMLAFDVLHKALERHGHVFTDAEAAVLEAAAAEIRDAIERIEQ